jgi:TatA/E family protein of Tat protein translocase
VFSLSPVKILVVVAIALILLGPDKLPEFARQVGGAWRSLKSLQERVETEGPRSHSRSSEHWRHRSHCP